LSGWKLLSIGLLLVTLGLGYAYYDASHKLAHLDLRGLQERINALEEKNALLAQELRMVNLSLEQALKQNELYKERIRELEAELSASTSGVVGYAELDAPAVRQVEEVIGEFPFYERRVVLEGAMIHVSAEIKPGSGRVLVVTKPLMGLVFQDAANVAVYVAQKKTGIELGGSDVVFSVTSEVEIPAIDGPSAGALMALLTIAALENKSLNQDVTITGSIDKDGRIGEIGGVVEKAIAAKEMGKKLILLPRANSGLIRYLEERQELFPGFVIIERKPVVVDAREYIEEKVGIRVAYVETIEEAMDYFTS
jgi:predicted S18 family serine protease